MRAIIHVAECTAHVSPGGGLRGDVVVGLDGLHQGPFDRRYFKTRVAHRLFARLQEFPCA